MVSTDTNRVVPKPKQAVSTRAEKKTEPKQI